MTNPPKRKRIVEIDLKTMLDVNDLISDLRDARSRAKRTGGEYHIRRESEKGKVIFNISFSHLECLGIK